ncbi:MaoC family dehydratase N-terminal domain-containing protein [Mesorhizobium sp. CO1-1-11]|uniref:FAS1-like dehydratase domain-containing protein n=1 Tax=Mesorhizobium sp. CO1-1-11 TaxID=2876636 RepID=UPI001CCD69DD|nr:MaoC family dehydratase N-terminal domain-containing protein [Mesorhizobium sp. CO1-1-11]MBZ9726315.1 MaoC family dehydratase N-terminal domain-containing protein [Mesorhizobium sp. CO1-1-11]
MVAINVEGARLLAATLSLELDLREGTALPPCWHWVYLHPHARTEDLRQDGHPLEAAPHPEASQWPRMWGSGSLRWHDEIRLGEMLRHERSIADVKMKTGRSGRLCVCDIVHRWSRDADLLLEEVQTIVYREPGEAPQARPDRPSNNDPVTSCLAAPSWEHTFCETELFRYSALTFNAHRIHYDADYARDVEGHPGLVVHGPLLATLTAGFAQASTGDLSRLSQFEYRIMAPVFCRQEARFLFDASSGAACVVSNGRTTLTAQCRFTGERPA